MRLLRIETFIDIGRVYVMNDSGKTISSWDLDDINSSVQKAA